MGTYAQGSQKSGSTFGPSRDVGVLDQVQLIAMQAVAAATQDVVAYLPAGAILNDVVLDATVAPTGATATIAIGTTVGGADLVAATDVKAAARTRPTFTAAQLALMKAIPPVAGQSDVPIYIRNTQTTPTAVGTFTISLFYHQPAG